MCLWLSRRRASQFRAFDLFLKLISKANLQNARTWRWPFFCFVAHDAGGRAKHDPNRHLWPKCNVLKFGIMTRSATNKFNLKWTLFANWKWECWSRKTETRSAYELLKNHNNYWKTYLFYHSYPKSHSSFAVHRANRIDSTLTRAMQWNKYKQTRTKLSTHLKRKHQWKHAQNTVNWEILHL